MSGGDRRVAALLVAGLLLAAACSGDDDDAASDRGSEERAGSAGGAEGAPATPSGGCGSSPVAAGQERVTLESGGQERWYLRHVPSAHDGEQPVPLVVDLHGYSEGAEIHVEHSELGAFGDEQGFVTLTPQGQGEVPLWNTSIDGPDVAFIGDLLDAAESDLCIDTSRVYVTGLSNGAMMTSAVACAHADRIAAAAPVAGVIAVDGCEPDRPVPVVSFHGTEDPFLDYEGGLGPAVAQLPAPDGEGTIGDRDDQEPEADDEQADALSVPEVMAEWAERNGCEGSSPEETEVADDVTQLSFTCPEGAEVELYRIDGGGHTWPGSPFLDGVEMVGETTFSISANEVMWEFFEAHPRD